jgi:hypothetical protein
MELNNGIKILGAIDTIYETDNGLEPDAEGFKEFFACLIEIKTLLSNTSDSGYRIGSLIEITINEPPKGIWLEDNTRIY